MSAEKKLQAIIDQFVADITAIVHQAAVESVESALGGSPSVAPKRGGGRKKAARKTTTRKAAAKAGKRTRITSAGKERLAGQIAAYVKANDGCGMGDLTKATGHPATRIRPIVKDLMAAGTIKSTGQKRGTKYHPGGGKAAPKKAAPKRKTSSKKTVKRKTARKAAKRKSTKRR
jgi:hypothetical protein